MKFKLTYCAEGEDDVAELHDIIKAKERAMDAGLAVSRALEEIRMRLKHCDDVTEAERRSLESLREILMDGDWLE